MEIPCRCNIQCLVKLDGFSTGYFYLSMRDWASLTCYHAVLSLRKQVHLVTSRSLSRLKFVEIRDRKMATATAKPFII